MKKKKTNSDPILDRKRLEEIAGLGLHEFVEDQTLNGLAEEAAREFGLPVAAIAIMLNNAQIFAASHGLGGWLAEINGAPAEWSLCIDIVRDGRARFIDNANNEKGLKNNPMVTLHGVQTYVGAPLTTSNGYCVGTFYLIGGETRHFSQYERQRLSDYAQRAVERLEQRAAERNATAAA